MKMVESDWWSVTHLLVTLFLSSSSRVLVVPPLSDVIVTAVCGSATNECSLALYLTGFQQAITGLGAVVMMPVLGNLSDVYGRKWLLLIPLALPIIPLGILAWQRTTNFFYAYYTVNTLTAMISDGGSTCLALSYLADIVHEEDRVSAFGILFGVICAGSLFGTLAARFLTISQIFQVATAASIVTVVYAAVLVKDTRRGRHCNPLEHPILTVATKSGVSEVDNCETSNLKRIPSPKDIIKLVKRSTRFTLLASISFFESLANMGLHSSLMFFLKARYNFKKNQFADILLIISIAATVSNVLFLPLIGPYLGEEMLLILGLSAAFLSTLMNSIGWAAWVPYAVTSMGFFYCLSTPTTKTMVSKEIGPNEQGIAQGCIVGVTSLAAITSPLIFTPLSAIFMGEGAPPNLIGFSIFCISLTYLIGVILSIFIKIIPSEAEAEAGAEAGRG